LGLTKPLLEITRADLDQITAVQWSGPVRFFQALLRVMKRGASIIQISTVSATIVLDDYATYTATKAATDHLIRCIASEFGEHGIRANSIAPGLTDTPMAAGVFANPALKRTFLREYPLGRLGSAEDIAAAALWLASDACFMTGEVLQVNGGATLRRNPRKAELMESLKSAFDK
jgi:2-hydroxycyclohexanecarboxyl-CoA dehydrogenase